MGNPNSLQRMIILALAVLFLSGCGAPAPGSVAEAPTATATSAPATSTPTAAPTATPIPDPSTPTATPIPPTATAVFPTLTPVPPTATPAGGLVAGARLTLGRVEAEIVRVAESTTSPVLKESPQAGMKFVLVELRLGRVPPDEGAASNRMFLENSLGKAYGPPKAYGEDPAFGRKFESDSITIYGSGSDLNVFFEVAADEDVGTLRLGYR